MYLIGFDVGSSSVKAALVDVQKGKAACVVQFPSSEMEIKAVQSGWAEQEPEMWWKYVCEASAQVLRQSGVSPNQIQGIGISYQMHGLVVVDKQKRVLRPAIIWCDSRAVEIGNRAFVEMGEQFCLRHLLNSPGNFTASKLRWIRENEPHLYEKIDKIMLPGDYIAMRLTGETTTTISGLSEGVFWDFNTNTLSPELLDYYGIDASLIPEIRPTFSIQGKLTAEAAQATGLAAGTPVGYRAGDQPNNALSLNVLNPGEIAATGGTSGVVYGVVDQPIYDLESRVNGFAHVNYTPAQPHIGILLCINGAGIQYSWMRQLMTENGTTYDQMEQKAASVAVGADGLSILPFGNGAERIFNNKNIGAQLCQVEFNRHTRSHFFRAALEGIAFAFVYGIEILKELGLSVDVMRVGNDNLFQSTLFSTTIATLVNSRIELIETTGAVGAARAAGLATGVYSSLDEALHNLQIKGVFEPDSQTQAYCDAYNSWRRHLKGVLAGQI